jgi:hypothetical protein
MTKFNQEIRDQIRKIIGFTGFAGKIPTEENGNGKTSNSSRCCKFLANITPNGV